MKRQPNKDDIRNEIEQQISNYLGEGGAIQEYDPGTSGLKDGELKSNGFGFERPRQERTPVPEVVAAIESRRRRKSRPSRKPTSMQPRKKVIYDDFGEPLRWVWVEE